MKAILKKVIKRLAIQSGKLTYYFAVFELTDNDITLDFVIKNLGYLFFIKEEKSIITLCIEFENDLKVFDEITDNAIQYVLIRLMTMNQGSVFSLEDFDDQKGNFVYTFSLS